MVLYISTVVTFAAEIKIQSADSSSSSSSASASTSDSSKTTSSTTAGQGKTDQSVAGSETASVAYSYGTPQGQVVYQQQPQVVYQQQPVAVQVQGSHYNGQKYPPPSKAHQVGYQGASLISSFFTETWLQVGTLCFLVPALFVFFFLLKASGGSGGNYGGASGGYGSNYGGGGGSIKPGLSVHAKFPSFPKISFGGNNNHYRSFDMDLVTKLALLAIESFA